MGQRGSIAIIILSPVEAISTSIYMTCIDLRHPFYIEIPRIRYATCTGSVQIVGYEAERNFVRYEGLVQISR